MISYLRMVTCDVIKSHTYRIYVTISHETESPTSSSHYKLLALEISSITVEYRTEVEQWRSSSDFSY